MALVDPADLADQSCVRVYIAGRLREAQRVEQVLTDRLVDYYVEFERFERRILGFVRREYDGVSFYVPGVKADSCRQWLREARLVAGLEGDGDGTPSPKP